MTTKKEYCEAFARTFRIWRGVVNRGTGKSDVKNYYNRGIRVCSRWLTFDNFLKDMGLCSRGYSIDRIDNNGDYAKKNCRWVKRSEQSYNKQRTKYVVYRGERVSVAKLARSHGLLPRVLYGRLSNGWLLEDAINTPWYSKYQKHLFDISQEEIPTKRILDRFIDNNTNRKDEYHFVLGIRQTNSLFSDLCIDRDAVKLSHLKYRGIHLVTSFTTDELCAVFRLLRKSVALLPKTIEHFREYTA